MALQQVVGSDLLISMLERLSWFRKTQQVSFDTSINSGGIDVKMNYFILEKK